MDSIVRLLEPVRIRWPLPIAGAIAACVLALVPATRTAPQAARAGAVVFARHHCADDQPGPLVRTLQAVELEKRWVLDEASPSAIDDALRTRAAPWEPFMYLLDSQPRMAVAGPAHLHSEQWSYEFGRDQDGGIWLVRASNKTMPHLDVGLYDRDIFLLPVGSSFRGVIER